MDMSNDQPEMTIIYMPPAEHNDVEEAEVENNDEKENEDAERREQRR